MLYHMQIGNMEKCNKEKDHLEVALMQLLVITVNLKHTFLLNTLLNFGVLLSFSLILSDVAILFYILLFKMNTAFSFKFINLSLSLHF